jgi:hypothetical protein
MPSPGHEGGVLRNTTLNEIWSDTVSKWWIILTLQAGFLQVELGPTQIWEKRKKKKLNSLFSVTAATIPMGETRIAVTITLMCIIPSF